MKVKWKKLILPWISGAVVGAAAVLARRRVKKITPGDVHDIRRNKKRIIIITEEQKNLYLGSFYLSQMIYNCEPTGFKLWSFLRSPVDNDSKESGQRIYHINPVIEFKSRDGEGARFLKEASFYATIHSKIYKKIIPEKLSLNTFIEFHKCHVGGSMNGIESGEKVSSRSPVIYYEFLD